MIQTKDWLGRIDKLDKDLREVKRKNKLVCSYEYARNESRPRTAYQETNLEAQKKLYENQLKLRKRVSFNLPSAGLNPETVKGNDDIFDVLKWVKVKLSIKFLRRNYLQQSGLFRLKIIWVWAVERGEPFYYIFWAENDSKVFEQCLFDVVVARDAKA